MNYKYHMPTKVFCGENCILNNRDVFKSLGEKALIVTGKRSAKMNGSEKDVKAVLDAIGIDYVIFDQVMSNPTIPCAYEGAAVAKENDVDFVIAIGGGSPIDAAKAMALIAAQDIAEDDLFSGDYQKALPIVAVPTTAGTGTEATQYSILTNDQAETKTSIASELIFPTISFLDAKYMLTLPLTATINTTIDALSHAVEGMFSVRASTVSNALAMKSIRMIMESIPSLLEASEKDSIEMLSLSFRERLMEASFLAGMVIAQTGTTVVHAMGYSLTYFKHIDHGRANGLLLSEFLRLAEKEQPELIRTILTAMKLNTVSEYKQLMDQLFGEKEAISAEEINQFTEKAMGTKNIANCIVKPKEYDLVEMYSVSFQ